MDCFTTEKTSEHDNYDRSDMRGKVVQPANHCWISLAILLLNHSQCSEMSDIYICVNVHHEWQGLPAVVLPFIQHGMYVEYLLITNYDCTLKLTPVTAHCKGYSTVAKFPTVSSAQETVRIIFINCLEMVAEEFLVDCWDDGLLLKSPWIVNIFSLWKHEPGPVTDIIAW
jgi:hypothetical protein